MGKTNNAIDLGSIIYMPIKIFESLRVVNERSGATLNLRYLFLQLLNDINLVSVGLRLEIGELIIARHHLTKVALVVDECSDTWLTCTIAQKTNCFASAIVGVSCLVSYAHSMSC